jgi:hypothetical protein
VWISSDAFITGDGGGSVRRWDLTKEGDQYRVNMRWRSVNGQLTLKDACVHDVQGLNDFNKRLLKQREAIGEPRLRLREASKKVMRMASAVSKFKSSPSDTDALNLSPASPAISSTRHSGQQIQQATGPGTGTFES